MKYDRLTISPGGSFTSAKNVSVQRLIDRLTILENKIENGELISTVQSEQGEQEIEFFVKHNAEVRKEAVEEFADKVRDKEFSAKIGVEWFAVVRSLDIEEIVKEMCGE